jgi:hypothetical protein
MRIPAAAEAERIARIAKRAAIDSIDSRSKAKPTTSGIMLRKVADS